jgi:hypothetical protein
MIWGVRKKSVGQNLGKCHTGLLSTHVLDILAPWYAEQDRCRSKRRSEVVLVSDRWCRHSQQYAALLAGSLQLGQDAARSRRCSRQCSDTTVVNLRIHKV